MKEEPLQRSAADDPDEIGELRVRLGTGANCSSIGSVVDTLFASAAAGTALMAAVMVLLRDEASRGIVTKGSPEEGSSMESPKDERDP